MSKPIANPNREGGFIVLHRCIQSSPLWRSFTAEQAWVAVQILLAANWKPSTIWRSGSFHRIERGELVHSLQTLADAAGVGVQVVRTTVAKMLADDSLSGGRGPFLSERKIDTGGNTSLRVLKVCRYSEYQDVQENPNTPANTLPTRCQHAANTLPTPSEPEEPREPEEPKKQLPVAHGPGVEVFEHWKTVMGHQRSTFDKKRRAAVEARLRDGYTPADLMAAVDGCALTPHNMGKNDRGERYDDLELICRDAAHVDRFKRNAMTPPSISAQRPRDPRFGMARAEDQHHPDLGPNGEARPLWFPGDDPALDPSRIP